MRWKDRPVFIVFDSDASVKPDVTAAIYRIGRKLTDLGAIVRTCSIPAVDGLDKTGLDDLLVQGGRAAMDEVIAEATPFEHGLALTRMNDDAIFIREPVAILDRRNGKLLNERQFRLVYANRCHLVPAGEKMREVSTAAEWLKWPMRAEVAGLTYAPALPGERRDIVDGRWNLWPGWGVEPAPGDVGPWHGLLNHVFQGAEAQAREWFERWLAYPLQYPGTKLFTAAIIWGPQGVGKGLIGETVRMIYGEAAALLEETHLHDKNNASWATKLFAQGDEITGSESRKEADRLKAMVTSPTTWIEEKYVAKFQLPSQLNYYFTSNHHDAFFMEDDDRRNFVHEVTSGKLIEAAHGKRFIEGFIRWRAGAGRAALFDYLLNLDLDHFDPSVPAPMTKAKGEMIRAGKGPVYRWTHDLVTDPVATLREVAGVGGIIGRTVEAGLDLLDFGQLKAALQSADVVASGKLNDTLIGKALREAGVIRLDVTKVDGRPVKLFAIRNQKRWRAADHGERAAHFKDHAVKALPPRY